MNIEDIIIKNNGKGTYTSNIPAIELTNCEHKVGMFGEIHTFWSKLLGFNGIKIYCCSDCGEILKGKRLKDFRENSDWR